LKETITEMRDNDGTGTQQDACKFLVDYMEVLEKQMQQPCEDCISREAVKKLKKYNFSYNTNTTIPKAGIFVKIADIAELPSVTPKFTDEEIQKIQELEQAQLEKAYELGKAESFEEWLSSFNTESAPQCFNAVQQLKEKLNGQMD
jgi:hypothetical protein